MARKTTPRKSGVTAEGGRYAARGVSASKKEVHSAVDKLDQGLFPGAFCKITPDYLTGSKAKCNVIHADGAGTKSILAYLHYRETGDASIFRCTAQDSLVMNIDDLLCVGATGRILISNTVNRNPHNVSGEILAALIQGTEDFLSELRKHGVDIHSGGGETADVPDLTGTLAVDSCATAVMKRTDVLDGSGITPGLAIVGLSGYGQCAWEDKEGSGIGSNGLTSARHDLLSSYYKKQYPETWAKETDSKLVYCGPYRLDDPLPDSRLTVGEALISPTRTYAPLIHKLLKGKARAMLKGLVHCSGGGQTKCLRFGRNVHFIKDNYLPVPPIFRAIQQASGTTDQEMYKVYNMGHRMEVYCKKSDAKTIIRMASDAGIEAQVIGHTEKTERKDGKNHITIKNNGKTLKYS